MATLNQQKKRIQKLKKENLSKLLFDVVKAIRSDIIKLNQEQLSKGLDVNSQTIGFYSYATQRITKGRKRAGTPFTAQDTGDFFKGFYLETFEDGFRVFSKDPKTHVILESDNWHSDQLFGLTDKDLKAVVETKLLPLFIKRQRETLGL